MKKMCFGFGELKEQVFCFLSQESHFLSQEYLFLSLGFQMYVKLKEEEKIMQSKM